MNAEVDIHVYPFHMNIGVKRNINYWVPNDSLQC